MTFLFVASQLWREGVRVAIVQTRRLRTPSQASSPRVLMPQLPSPSTSIEWFTFGILFSHSIPVFVQGTCTPQVHAHVGRTMHWSGGLRVCRDQSSLAAAQ